MEQENKGICYCEEQEMNSLLSIRARKQCVGYFQQIDRFFQEEQNKKHLKILGSTN